MHNTEQHSKTEEIVKGGKPIRIMKLQHISVYQINFYSNYWCGFDKTVIWPNDGIINWNYLFENQFGCAF
jgi:hypothetical protein